MILRSASARESYTINDKQENEDNLVLKMLLRSNNLKEDESNRSIFVDEADYKEESPSAKLLSVRKDNLDGEPLKRSIVGKVEEYVETHRKKQIMLRRQNRPDF